MDEDTGINMHMISTLKGKRMFPLIKEVFPLIKKVFPLFKISDLFLFIQSFHSDNLRGFLSLLILPLKV